MALSVQDLMRDRIKVIADYPGCPFEVGKVLHVFDTAEECEGFSDTKKMTSLLKGYWKFDKYPHLFKPLQWPEDRKPEDMPGYVKWRDKLGKEKIVKVTKWVDDGYNELFFEWDEDPHPKKIGYYPRSIDALPATETEYNDYLQSLKQK